MYRVIPAIEPTEKLIAINENLALEHQIMPFEVLRKYLSDVNPKKYAVVPCSCRTAAKLGGKPCNQTDENYCIATGFLAPRVIRVPLVINKLFIAPPIY